LIDISGGSLPDALAEFARETGAEILYDGSINSAVEVPPIRGFLSQGDALAEILAGTDLQFRADSGAFLIFQARSAAKANQELPVPEILVIGRRTQNADIRRRESDVQPYDVITGEEISRSHIDNLGDYFRSRVTTDAQVISPSNLPNGEANSEIDLRGLGSDATLILLDGRRLPSIPASTDLLSFRQSDLNSIPLHVIDRVEVLTGTAGGIYGFGALGGVINVVTRRKYRGLELHSTVGLTSRGDARHTGIEGRLGFTPDGGRTDVMLYLSHRHSQPLRVGQRDYRTGERKRIYERFPELFDRANFFEFGNSIGVINATTRAELILKPEFGGGPLGGSRTFLPLGFDGTSAELATSLRQNAGKIDFTSAPPEATNGIGSHASTSAAIFSVRRNFGENVEAYFDGVALRNQGRHSALGQRWFVSLRPNSPNNPFINPVDIVFPILSGGTNRQAKFASQRYTLGLVGTLPQRWRASAETTFGLADYSSDISYDGYSPPQNMAFNPFGTWSDIQQQVVRQAYSFKHTRIRNRYQEQLLRLAGPVFTTDGGEAALTLLAERRSESVPEHVGLEKSERSDTPFRNVTADWGTQTKAYYGEFRLPLTGDTHTLIKNFEMQLAARSQELVARFWSNSAGVEPLNRGERLRRKFQATSYTAGVKVAPWSWLMLRGSYATGQQPPPLVDLISFEGVPALQCFKDPKRGNRVECSSNSVSVKLGGSPILRMARANTVSLGAVVAPLGDRGPRISVDFSRIERIGDPYPLTRDQVLAYEDAWPERVVRSPLSEADRARGFTGGPIAVFDGRATNGRSRSVQALDARLEWPATLSHGRLRIYGSGTLQIRNTTKSLFEPALESIGFRDGPLRWRGNGGLDWTRGETSVGFNVQYFGKYGVSTTQPVDEARERRVPMFQGGNIVPAQVYLDANASHRFRIRGLPDQSHVLVSLGVRNLLDKAPPFQTSQTGGYGFSPYGDPRRRRFELTISTEM
jgi:outer membrane receptor protein involved in Fe transport